MFAPASCRNTTALLQRKFNDPRRDLGRGPVRQDRLLAADLLQRQLAAPVIEFLEAVEAVAAIAKHLAGHIAKLPGKLQQAHPRPASPGLGSRFGLMTPNVRSNINYYNESHRAPPWPPRCSPFLA
jgi:hypothetical protein